MSINKRYRPNYKKLYPGITLTPEILSMLEKSDRKIEYLEHDLKHSRIRKNKEGEIIGVTPPRERSLEELGEKDKLPLSVSSAEDMFFAEEDRQELYRCLDLLEPTERALIDAVFFEGLTDETYALRIGMSQTGISKRKRTILCKLLKMLKR